MAEVPSLLGGLSLNGRDGGTANFKNYFDLLSFTEKEEFTSKDQPPGQRVL